MLSHLFSRTDTNARSRVVYHGGSVTQVAGKGYEDLSFSVDLISLQKKLISTAVSNQTVRSLCPIFFQKAEELRDCLDKEINLIDKNKPYQTHSTSNLPDTDETDHSQDKTTNNTSDGRTIDIFHWTSRASFDVIGLAGLDYPFNSLCDEDDKVRIAYQKIFDTLEQGSPFKNIIQLWFPIIETLFVSCFDIPRLL
jgi:hypothetical protein